MKRETKLVGRVTPCAPSSANPRVRRVEDCPPYRPTPLSGDSYI